MGHSEIDKQLMKILWPKEFGKARERFTDEEVKTIKSLVDQMVGSYKDRHWSHSACHAVEEFKPESSRPDWRTDYGLLSDPRLFECVDKIVAELKTGSHNSTGRIVGPIIWANIYFIKERGLESDLYFKPNSMNQEWLAGAKTNLDSDYMLAKAFAEANNPKEFMANIVRQRVVVDQSACRDLVELASLLVAATSEAEVRDYFNSELAPKIEVNGLGDNVITAAKASELVRGVFCDVDGTLLDRSKFDEGHFDPSRGVDSATLNYLKTAHENGIKVTIFTGADPELKTKELRALGVAEEFLPVQSKEPYKGKLLEVLIDDTKPLFSGFGARYYFQYTNEGCDERFGKVIETCKTPAAGAVDVELVNDRKERMQPAP